MDTNVMSRFECFQRRCMVIGVFAFAVVYTTGGATAEESVEVRVPTTAPLEGRSGAGIFTDSGEATVSADAGIDASRGGCQEDFCAECAFGDSSRCQRMNGMYMYLSDDRWGTRRVDDFRPSGDTVSRLCWWFGYLDPIQVQECAENPPHDVFFVRFYADDNGRPGLEIGPVGGYALVPDGQAHMGEGWRVWQYTAPLDPPLAVSPGDCYWIEIAGNGTEDCATYWPTSEDGNISSTDRSDGPSGWGGFTAADFPFCLDTGIVPATNPGVSHDGGCGDLPVACCLSPIVCDNTGTISTCQASEGRWFPYDDCTNTTELCRPPLEPPSTPPPPLDAPTNRYVSFVPSNAGLDVAFSIWMPDLSFGGWVGAPTLVNNVYTGAAWVSLIVDAPVYRVWDEDVVHVTGCAIAPGHLYELIAHNNDLEVSLPHFVSTVPIATPGNGSHADCVGSFDPVFRKWAPPDGVVNFLDIHAVLQKFMLDPTAPHFTWVDLDGQWPDQLIGFGDVAVAVFGFVGDPYPASGWSYQIVTDCPLGPDPDG